MKSLTSVGSFCGQRSPKGASRIQFLVVTYTGKTYFPIPSFGLPSDDVQLLHFLGETFDALVASQYRLEDMEVDALLPTLVEKSGQAKERFRVAIRGLLAKVPTLCSYAKYSPLLLQVRDSWFVHSLIALVRV